MLGACLNLNSNHQISLVQNNKFSVDEDGDVIVRRSPLAKGIIIGNNVADPVIHHYYYVECFQHKKLTLGVY